MLCVDALLENLSLPELFAFVNLLFVIRGIFERA